MIRAFCLTLLAVVAATAPSLGAGRPQAQAPAASATAQSPATATTPAGPVGNVQNGKRLYVRDGCWQCHGYAGQGGRAVPDTVPLAGTTLSLAAFVKYVRQPDGAMPAYTDKVISDQELADVYAHVKTFAGPRPPAEIPLLKDLPAR
jgi:mono/diheme cytochrome c family protein